MATLNRKLVMENGAEFLGTGFGANADALVLQSLNGTVCLSLHGGKVVIDAPLTEMNTNLLVNGNFTVTGDADVGANLRNGGVNVGATHVHGGVQSGPNNTGTPT